MKALSYLCVPDERNFSIFSNKHRSVVLACEVLQPWRFQSFYSLASGISILWSVVEVVSLSCSPSFWIVVISCSAKSCNAQLSIRALVCLVQHQTATGWWRVLGTRGCSNLQLVQGLDWILWGRDYCWGADAAWEAWSLFSDHAVVFLFQLAYLFLPFGCKVIKKTVPVWNDRIVLEY